MDNDKGQNFDDTMPARPGATDLPLCFDEAETCVPERVEAFSVEEVISCCPGLMRKHANVKFTPGVVATVLNEIANCGVYGRACQAAGLTGHAWQILRRGDKSNGVDPIEGLEELAVAAKEAYTERISAAIHNRAIEGWLEPVYQKGQLIGHKRKFSDRLLELQARCLSPRYQEKKQIDVNVGGSVLMVHSAAPQNASQDSPVNVEDKKQSWIEERRKADEGVNPHGSSR